MPHVSQKPLSKEEERVLIHTLTSVFVSIQHSQEMVAFLASLLTPTEKIMLAKRLAIAIFLEEGNSDAEIARMLHVTRITVAKMRLYIQLYGEGFFVAVKKLQERKELDEFKKFLLSLQQ